ncbi:Ada metal-binding domain-containing protein [Streptomyces sp. NPDC001848]|uniref:Ada metal-binding domain-containing protein n=1 Tax=Streptomyces sp. NPDC001848 TaxID=3364618 RepID=UPI0036B2620F
MVTCLHRALTAPSRWPSRWTWPWTTSNPSLATEPTFAAPQACSLTTLRRPLPLEVSSALLFDPGTGRTRHTDFGSCYQAVTDKDRRHDGPFVTAVVTTGICCRPSCRARLPQAENVSF